MSSKLPVFELPDPMRLPGVPSNGSFSTPVQWERGPLTARELELLEALDPDVAHAFTQLDLQSADFGEPVAPQASLDPAFSHSPSETPGAPTELPEDMEASLLAIQKQLDLLTAAREKHHQSKRGKEGDQDPNDPIDLLLTHGLRALLRQVVALFGAHSFIGVFVKFDQMTFKAKTFEGTNVIATNGNQLMQMLSFWRRSQTQERLVLDNITGSFRPSRTCLVLGPPRSGKSTLLKAIAGRLQETHATKLQGMVEYAGLRLREKPQPKDGIKLVKLVGYVPQIDEHIPTLTVRETVEFSRACVNQPAPKAMAQECPDEKARHQLLMLVALQTEFILSMLGIRHVGDTIVGNEVLRGISGGQRKRLTTAEMLSTFTPVLMMDEISTGLDSATTFQICTALRAFARCMKMTIAVSLLQPTPETYSTFDEILVMAAGTIAYQGPRHTVLPYFMELGFQCPEAKDVAEFLQEVTLLGGIQKYRVADIPPRVVINAPEDFGPAWLSSRQFRQRQEEDAALDEQSRYEMSCLPTHTFVHDKLTSHYTQTAMRSFLLCLKRQAVLTVRNTGMQWGRVGQVVVCGLVLGSLYFQTAKNDFNSKYAILFFAMLFISLQGFASIPAIVLERQVIYRQTASHFFHPLPYSIASNLVDIPMAVLETVIFMTTLYWMCGLSPAVPDFFSSVLTVFLVKLSMNGFFRVLAGMSPNQAVAQALASLVTLLFSLHSGFLIAKADMKSYWIWVYWINPLQYGMTGLSLIEFHSSQYTGLRNPADPSLGTLGNYYLTVKGMPHDDDRIWLGWVFNLCFYILMNLFNSALLSYVRYPPKFPAQPPVPTEGVKLNDAEPIPFTPCVLAWKSINYDVDIPGKRGKDAKLGLRLLNGVSGFARPGTMTALMGSSGAGKTTLLDVLAGRKNTGRVEGDILLNGQKADPVTFSRVSGYVEQMDIHSPSATVAEALCFSAFLRLPRDTPAAEKEAFVWQVIAMLNLQQVAHSPIGTKQDGLSVEQVKRVTIGVEMAANPAVLFLDEPTSGLDSMAADIVMDALKAVAASGRTLICTIHQPSSYLFSMFGNLLLLTRGGKTVFFGETGKGSANLVAYFNAIPGAPQHDGEQNPATWMLNVLATEGVDFAEQYRNSQLCASMEADLAASMEVTGEQLTSGHLYQATVPQQFRLLVQKWFRLHWRTPGYNLARFFSSILIALMLGSIFFQNKMGDQQAVFTMVGLQFTVLLFVGILFANTVQGLIAVERTVFYREQAAHMYYSWVFNSAMGLAELPYITFNCIVLANIFYWMAGLNSDAATFFTWFLVFWLYVIFFTYSGLFLGCFMPTEELATITNGGVTSLLSLLAGFMLPKDSIPWWWRWLYYLNPMTYAMQPIFSSQFYCAAADADPTQPGDCPTFVVFAINGDSSVVPVWSFVKLMFNLDYADRWLYVGMLVICIVIVRIGCGLALAFINHAKR
eukprot:EG_transcript_344